MGGLGSDLIMGVGEGGIWGAGQSFSELVFLTVFGCELVLGFGK